MTALYHRFFRITFAAMAAVLMGAVGLGQSLIYNRSDISTGIAPVRVAVADFDRDGKRDIAYLLSGATMSFSILPGFGNGRFLSPLTETFGAASKILAVADVNSDGNPDAITFDSGNNTAYVLLGNGDRTLQAPKPIANVAVGGIAVGDFNGDGRPDLVFSASPGSVNLFLGNGDGTFVFSNSFPTGGNGVNALAALDLNHDGKMDVVVVSMFSNTVSVLLGQGNGSFQSAVNYPLETSSAPQALALGDINGDGIPDIVVAETNAGNIAILLGKGDGSFQNPTLVIQPDPSFAPQIFDIVIADMNHDGKPDLVAAVNGGTPQTSFVKIFFGNGDGTFAGPQAIGVGPGATSVAVADFDNDGIPDIVVNASSTTFITVLTSGIPGSLPPALTVAKTHNGFFSQGQQGATFSITVGNTPNTTPTSGTVTVTESLPGDLSLDSLAGVGWTCTGASCSRSDPLAAGASYPPITVTVDVRNNAGSHIVNAVNVSGGGSVPAQGSDGVDVGTSGCTLSLLGTSASFDSGGGSGGIVVLGPAGCLWMAHSNVPWLILTGTLSGIGNAGFGYSVDPNPSAQRIGTISIGNSTFTVTEAAPAGSLTPTVSIWSASAVPQHPLYNAPSRVTVGTRFRSDVDGTVVGVRFYKGAGNNGDHIGAMYTGSGTFLSLTLFGNETGSGWQQGDFVTPVPIVANQTYVVAFYTSSGFPYDEGYFANQGVDSPPLHALKSGVDGPNGAYIFAQTVQFPSNDGSNENFWVDVAFRPTAAPQAPDLTIIKTHTGTFSQGQTGAGYSIVVSNTSPTSTSGTVTVTESLPAGLTATSISGTGWTCTQPAGPCTRSDVLAGGSFFPTLTLSVNVSANAPASVTNTVTVSGGGETNTSNNQATDLTMIQVSAAPPSTVSIWNSSAVPQSPQYNAPPVTVGTKFRSDVSGTVTGIRFYKGTGNNGIHTGLIYSNSGVLLAQATFTSETASGWQQVNLSTPVSIAANTTYVVAYYSPSGFAYDASYFGGHGADNAPLHALQSGVDGPNGVYAFGASPQFPSSDGLNENFWVDVTFLAGGPALPAPDLTVTSTHVGNFTQDQRGVTYTLKVTNVGTAPTTGVVTVNEQSPSGFFGVSMAGDGWACLFPTSVQESGFCTRSDSIGPNESFPNLIVTLDVGVNAPPSVSNSATVSGGGDGNPLNNQTSDPTTVLPLPTPGAKSIWSPSDVPQHSFYSSQPITVGTKFRSDVNGTIVGFRFYKDELSNELPTAMLFDANGILQGQAKFEPGTFSGWQQVNIAPIQIAANTTYTVAYFSFTGFAYDAGYFANRGVDNAPLHALKSGVDGPNGVYRYGNTGLFPTTDGLSENFWADVVFVPASPGTSIPDLTVTSGHTGDFAQGQTAASYTIFVYNSGTGPSSGTITVTDTLPVGLTPVSIQGQGWTCIQPAGPCTSNNPIGVSSTLTPLTLVVNVAANAPASVTNIVTVSGGNEVNTSNDQFSDPTTVQSAAPVTSTSIWSASATPQTPLYNGPPVTLGVKFQTDTVGMITSLRFYKGAGNNGTHIGLLYTSTGLLLARIPFTGETASGWQQVDLSTPVMIAPNTTYVVAYFTDSGFAYDAGYFASHGRDNPPLHALQSGVNGPNGLYAFGSSPQFPSSDGLSENFWADVVFLPIIVPTTSPDMTIAIDHITPFTQGGLDAAYAISVRNAGSASTSGTVTASVSLPSALVANSISGQGWACTQPTGPCTRSDVLDAGRTYPSIFMGVNVSSTAPASVTSLATVSGGGETNTSNSQGSEATAIAASAPGAHTIWSPTVIPQNALFSAPPVTLGTKFRSDVSGTITAIRFYKGAGNNGTHLGMIYSSDGTLLQQTVFINETFSGWQQAVLSLPIAANTTYIVAYFTSTGFAYDTGYFSAQGADNPPLHALQSGIDGPNGLYAFGSSPLFPSSDGLKENFWVDVVFTPANP